MELIKGRTDCAHVYLREMENKVVTQGISPGLHGPEENHKHFELQNVPCRCGVSIQIIVVDVYTKDLEWGQLLYLILKSWLLLATLKLFPQLR